ncbi:phosphate ABC transporter permease PstA [Alicyclobacillus sp. ALC3]|uniref:phosphate ABC transporter permease PstA n=1 Tax=Alicyclobacillus sp. ALC3 TaxID=2796143 RepID=UPI00237973EC|nr:phosphate ABC transporter permease PstA [Alicyclobacillus sp. ALC3]WDL96835.1 phosphate ABC transporter permease PstA [Alicyclobacillus sp. ALC3]
MNHTRRRSRRVGSIIGWGFGWLSTAFVLFGLVEVLVTVVFRGLASFHLNMLWTVTSGVAGGLANALLGTLLLVLISTVIAAPLGILGGIYVTEFAHSRVAAVIQFMAEVLSGVPSIVIGYFGYLLMVLRWGWQFSALAGGIALMIIMLPYILRTTQSAMEQVPRTHREAAWALGMTRFQAVSKVIWRPAAGGIATGLLLAIGISMGETAPLLYTAGWSPNNPSLQLTHHQVGYLTYVVWTYINEPYAQAHALAYAAAFLLLMFILVIHLVIRGLIGRNAVVRD